ncbi:MAG: sodium-dependent transporter [Desulfovibrionales bacterium]|nr:sodium-dependent transporter [Desulfovibrionales bacterium]
MTSPAKNRDGFATALGVLTATLGSAVGLGNIWKFPYMTGEGGGAAFLIVYLLATLVVGLPVMIGEIMLGRKSRANAIATWHKFAPGSAWFLVGAGGVIAAFCIMAFYTDVAGWVFAYVIKAISGQLNAVDPKVGEAAFGAMVSDPLGALSWQWFVLAVVSLILIGGVSKGIEKTTKILMPVLFLMLCAICVRSLMLPKAGEGLAFLFAPDFSKVTVTVVLNAMGLAFFKLSLGMGTMMTYGSYFLEEADIPKTTLRVMLADLTVSMLAGIAIFPAVFNYGFEPTAGPGLVFMTMPAVFSSFPGGQFFMTLFFILTSVATIGAMCSLFEVPVAFIIESCPKISRRVATIIVAIGLAASGAPATLSFSVLSDVSIFGKNFFDMYDFLSSNILLPSGGAFICLYVGWLWGWERSKECLTNNGHLSNEGILRIWFMLVKYITPVLVFIVMLKGLGAF